MTKKQCPLGENCDLTTAWMAGAAKAQDQIKAQAAEIERLRGDVEKAVKLLEAWIEVSEHCNIQEGVCCCGENMEGHGNEHFPLDHGVYIAGRLEVETRTTLAELTGAKP